MTGQGGVEIGTVLAGRYRIERVLGQGGMGLVVQAMHLQLHQPVAMKFLLPEVLGNQQVVQRFLREAQAAVRLKSEHVARVIDVGSLETGAPYMVLEYLEGADLSSLLRSQLTVGGIIDLVLQACEALAEAHSLGIVHRDIKPANFFITRGAGGTPLLKVLDFGISKIPVTDGQLTATQTVMGTPAYMSPEQMRSSRDVDHRSDIWSLGVVLYELLQGAPPFGGDTFSSMVLKVVNDPLPRMTVRLPGDLDSIVYRCLEKEPARRFQDIAELALALAKYAQSETQAAISVQRTRSIVGAVPLRAALEPSSALHAAPSTLSSSAGAKTVVRPRSRRWLIAAAMGVLIGIVLVVVAASSGGGRASLATTPISPPPPAAPAPMPAPPPVTTPALAPVATTPPIATAPPPAPTPVTTPALAPVATTPSAPAAPAPPQPDAPSAARPDPLPSVPAGPGPEAGTPSPSPMSKKQRVRAKPSASAAKMSASPAQSDRPLAKPAPPVRAVPPAPSVDDDPLGTRN